MESKHYIVFSLNASLYGIEAFSVQEIFFLPELTPIVEAPPEMVGVLNLRGEILPVMDLHFRLGYGFPEYRLTDSVIVLISQGLRFGIVVNEVHDVQKISANAIATDFSYKREVTNQPHLVRGVAKVEADIVMLLNPEKLLQSSEQIEALITEKKPFNLEGEADTSLSFSKKNRLFSSNTTSEEKAIFRERADSLMRQAESQDFSGSRPMAVINLNGEYFGVDLGNVREFTDIRKVTPIPCCPAYIVGNMNLRGEILTLIDIRGVLNLPLGNLENTSKAMIACIDDLVAGVIVDQVLDVMYLHLSEMMPVPAAARSGNNEYLRGTVAYGEKMMAILDLPKLLTQTELMVDEEV
ncbi:chemotaxis protein CheW [Coleofasciculus sp. FACHB-1120]|uniref:chemotaxis protein CheW n=1 Tax=Coleofasciculus sp. FACHB-1120 TaxID=2692783 RepID=UPI0016840737|nr:chemotaxis protein CheW [Coleofasciculus sp. FACHB-1120]MBD2740232.1 purine-binding chemotaxis protein CheW [Coleofasciculus sp. FACHB-1120]